MIRVAVVDDHAIVRHGLVQILGEDHDLVVSLEAGSIGELREKMTQTTVDVLILDVSLPGISGLEALPEIKKQYPEIAILILSMYSEEQYAIRALKAGASGYLNKECAPDQLVSAIKIIAKGERYLTSGVANLLASRLSKDDNRPSHLDLSEREFQVLRMIGSGTSLKEIGCTLNISVKTVSTYRTRLLKKNGYAIKC